jgi:hypothetical protein
MALFSMEERTHDVSFVMQRIAAGDHARFFHSHFGQQVVELSRSWIWIFNRKTRVSLSPLEIARVKDALYARRKEERKLAANTDAIEDWYAGRRTSTLMTDHKLYVQYGCGFSTGEGWLNFDSSPTLRVERTPIVGWSLSALFSGLPQRFPAAVQYGDICKGLPIPDSSVVGCYASHVLEHLSFEDFQGALANTFRMLAPGGIFRMIVPDLHERAKRYLAEADRSSPDAASHFLRSTYLGTERRPTTPVQHLKRLFGGSMHLWMWDVHSMSSQLSRAGFVNIRRCQFGDAADPMFARVEDKGRFCDEHLGIDECAIEAQKPA